MMRTRQFCVFVVGPVLTLLGGLPGCSEPTVTSHPALINPNATSWDSGGTDDIYEATQQAITSLMSSGRLKADKGNRVVLGNIVNRTGIPNYDEAVIYNKFLSDFTTNAGDRLIFLNRDAVQAERQRQLAGQVKTSGVDPAPAGADLVLDIELRQLPGAATQTIQYTFRLTQLDGAMLWTKSFEIKKQRG